MIRSMTAFTRQAREGKWGAVALELRSVNHRFLDMALRLPEELRVLEPRLRERISERLGRGKIDCTLRYEAPSLQSSEMVINTEFTTRLTHACREVDGLLYNSAPISSLEVLKWPGVLQAREADIEQVGEPVLALLEQGLDDLITVRGREGEKLKTLVEQRCAGMDEIVARVRERLPVVQQRMREKLLARLAELKADVDTPRLEQELVYLAQRLDVDEELDRLQAHLGEIRRVLGQDKPVGRRLDFLMQELNREANTLGSKSADTETTRASVDMKVFIEQMREQIQNIE